MKGNPVRSTPPAKPCAAKNLAVEAGAGCGKTTFLVNEVVAGLSANRFRMRELAVITFTRKAADELKGRIAGKLKDALPADPAMADHLKEIGDARIETIHAFCAALLKERPVEARCDPSFRMLDEEEQVARLESVWDGWIAERLERHPAFFERMIGDDALTLKRADTGFGPPRSLAFHDLIKIAVAHREADLFVPGRPESLAALRKGCLAACRGRMETCAFDKVRERMGEFVTLLSALRDGSDEAALARLKEAAKLSTLGGASAKEIRDEWKSLVAGFLERFDYALRFPAIESLYRETRELALDFVSLYRERLRADGLMDFHEALNGLRTLLKEGGPDLRGHFKRRFAAIYVDEFQDTDPLQAEMLFYLCEEEGSHAKDWRDPGFRLAEGKLCVVGDPKQSIYRFRRADIAVYREAARRIADPSRGGEHRSMPGNHRAGPALLDWVNALFAPRMNPAGGGSPTQADYVPLRAVGKNRTLEGAVRFVECAQEPPPTRENGSRSADEIRDLEARLTARWLADHTGPRDGKRRAGVRARADVLVLFRKKVSLRLAAAYLDELGVPYEISAEGLFFGRPEVLDGLNLLRALANPRDAVSLAAALRGPFFGLSDRDLRDWKTLPRHLSIPFEPSGDPHPVGRALDALHALKEASRRESAAALLERALGERGLFASYDATFRGRGRLANLVRLIEWLKRFAGSSLPETVRLANDAAGREAEPPAVSLRAGDVDAVRLMTVHKAKGLEAPVVYLADGNAGAPRGNLVYPDAASAGTAGAVVYKLGSGSRYATPETEAAKAEDERRTEEEEERLRYVAATRAKELFLVNRIRTGTPGTGFAAPFTQAEGTDRPFRLDLTGVELYAGAVAADTRAERPPESLRDELSGVREVPRRIERLLDDGTKVESPSLAKAPGGAPPPAADDGPGVRLHAQDSLPDSPAAPADLHVTYDPDSGAWSAIDLPAATRGTIVHKLLELDPDDLERAAKAMLEGGPFAKRANQLAALAKKMRERRGLRDRVRRAARVMREVPLRFTASDGTHYDGTIDLLFEEADGWVLVDWKTAEIDGADSAERLANKYEAQMEIYEAGLAQLGIRVKEKILVGG